MYKNRFDIVTCAGLVNGNYMDYTLFEQMILGLDKGGMAIFATRFSYMGDYWFDPILRDMQKEGRWKEIY